MPVELHRFISWLQTYGTGVQALCAIVSLIASVILVGVTARYVRLTQRMLEASEASHRAGFLPDLGASIQVHYPNRDELAFYVSNDGTSPIKIISAEFTRISLFKWGEEISGDTSHMAEVVIRPGTIPTLSTVFLRTKETSEGLFKMAPVEKMDEQEWNQMLPRTSLHATAVVECSDITGRVFYTFTVHRNAHLGSKTRIECRSKDF